tara:strand:- start:29220 stop:30185 length:966 start_codon:yes stop_codon:yes gene_type:complete
MTVPTGTTQSYQMIGIREDLSDIIYDISPMETPFVSMIGKGSAKNTNPEWQIDALDAATADNAVIEGDDATNDALDPTVRLRNYTQLMDKAVEISSTANAVNTAGRGKEESYQVAKRGREIKRDIEASFLSLNPSVAGAAGTARKSAGVGAWLASNTSHGTSGSAGGWNAGTSIVDAPTTGDARTLTEAIFKTNLAAVWTAGGNPGLCLVNSAQKENISAFTGIATLYRDTGQSKKQASIMGAADLYISDYGEIGVIADRFAPTDTIYNLDVEYWGSKVLQPMKVQDLAKTGHASRKLLSTELTLCSKNEDASGGIFDLSA